MAACRLIRLVSNTPDGQRAEAASAFFIVMYVAISLPVIGVGLAADLAGLQAAGVGFSLAVALLAASALIALRGQGGSRGMRL